jgi:hypothetical protein
MPALRVQVRHGIARWTCRKSRAAAASWPAFSAFSLDNAQRHTLTVITVLGRPKGRHKSVAVALVSSRHRATPHPHGPHTQGIPSR